MKKTLILLCLAICSSFAIQAANPKANEAAIVQKGNARFTILTDRLIRMEWSEDGKFEDNASLAIINRELPVPSFTRNVAADVLTIRTGKVTLTYRGDGKFDENNLAVTFSLGSRKVTWKPGMEATGNLMGTTRTLDGCKGFEQLSKSEKELEQGILSRDGWAIVDESDRHILVKDDSDWGEWVSSRPSGNRQDLYIFAYGHDYTDALRDFTKVAGRIPLPPKYTLGYWWSRYWIYTDDEIRGIASKMRENGIPMDIFIIDMDWHLTWKDMDQRVGHDEFGQRRGWTGYTWNRDLIPDPEGLLGDLHKMGYKTALNLHPASGIRPYENCYDSFIKDYLSRTKEYDGPKDYTYGKDGYKYAGLDKAVGKEGSPAPSAFRLDQQEWANAYFNSVIHPLEKQGIDFWWLDWQQWKQSRYVDGLSNTFWCNYTFFNDKVRRSRSQGMEAPRPFIYHRWGGLGSHRYQIGFSGDTYDEWSVLAFLPYFTATASNVGYGYWGHDIGGHMQMKDHQRPTEPEMYTRWLQYGVFTPIFKTHSTQKEDLNRAIWLYPTHYEYMKQAIELRYALTPYIYGAAREAFDTGVSMCRPLYYSWPEEDKAYTCHQEFMFGDSILATVLCQSAGADGRTERKMWFPKGYNWYDMALHTIHMGGSEKTLSYAINENPWYVKAGSVIPLANEGVQSLQDKTDAWRILVVPGPGKSICTLYEDDGITQSYEEEYATTLITKEDKGSSVKITVAPRQGNYKGAPQTRTVGIVLEGVEKVKSVKVNGNSDLASIAPTPASLSTRAVSISLPQSSASETLMIEIIR